jgi:hypothetical protein
MFSFRNFNYIQPYFFIGTEETGSRCSLRITEESPGTIGQDTSC